MDLLVQDVLGLVSDSTGCLFREEDLLPVSWKFFSGSVRVCFVLAPLPSLHDYQQLLIRISK